MTTADPAADVLADLLLAAVEEDRVGETYDLLSDLVGVAHVRTAHSVVFDRLADAVEIAATPPPPPDRDPDPGAGATPNPSDDTLALLASIRATTPGKKGAPR